MPDGKTDLYVRPDKLKEFQNRLKDAKDTDKFHVLEIQKYRWVTKIHSIREVEESKA
jgi:hypothetical protein